MDGEAGIGAIQGLEPGQSGSASWRFAVVALVMQVLAWEEMIRHHFPEQALSHPGRAAPFPLSFFMSLENGRPKGWVPALNLGLLLLAGIVMHQATVYLTYVP